MHNSVNNIVARFFVKVKLRKPSILALTDQGIISVCNFLTIFVLARELPVETFGIVVLIYTALRILTSFQHASLTQAHNVLAAQLDGSDYRDFNSTLIVLQLSFSLVGVSLLSGSALVFQRLQMHEFALGLAALGLVLVPWLTRDLVRRTLYTQLRISASLLNDTVSYGLQLAGIIILLKYPGGKDVRNIFLVLGASSAVAVGFGIVQLWTTFSIRAISMASFRQRTSEIWKFGRWLGGGQLLSWIGKYGHSWIIAAILGVGPLGGYGAAVHLSNILNPIDLACRTYIPPKASRIYARAGHLSLTRWLRSRAAVVGSLYLSIVILLILFARPLLDLFYDGKFSSTELVLVLCLGAISRAVSFGSMFFSITLTVIEKTYAVFIGNVIAVVFVLTVSLVIIQSLGVIGAPLARIILGVVLAVYGYAMVARNSPQSTTIKVSSFPNSK